MSKMASDEALWRKLVRAAGENEYELGALEAVGERTGVVWVCRGLADVGRKGGRGGMPPAPTDQSAALIFAPSTSDRSPIAVELCCGMGAIGIGVRSLGFRVAHAYDAWDAAVGIYNHNAPEPVATVCDILHADGKKLVLAQCRDLADIDLL